MDTTAQMIDRLVVTLQLLPSLQTLWLVGSYTRSEKVYQDIDVLAAFEDGNVVTHGPSIIKELKQVWPSLSYAIIDDSVRVSVGATTPINIAVYDSKLLFHQIKDYCHGIALNGEHRPWAAGYWLPEALCADMASAICLHDCVGLADAIHELLGTYPESLSLAISEICILEIEQKLPKIVSNTETAINVEQLLLSADVSAALVRLAFARSRCYLRGFRQLSAQVEVLSNFDREIYELANVIACSGTILSQEIVERVKDIIASR